MARETGAIIEPEVERELDRVCASLEDGGYRVVAAGIPVASRAPELWAELICAELLHFAMPVWREQLADSNRQHIEAMFGLFDTGSAVGRYVAGFVERRRVAQETAIWMEEQPLVVTPVAGMPTPPLDFDHYLSLDATRDLFDRMRNVVWVNCLSLPSIALPNGIQIVARRFRETEALAAAAAAARALAPVEVAEPVGAREAR